MSTLFSFLLGAVGPLAIRLLTTIGFAAVTFTGVTALTDALVAQAHSSWAALPAAVLMLATKAGLPAALGLIFGAFAARVTLWVGAKSAQLLFKGIA